MSLQVNNSNENEKEEKKKQKKVLVNLHLSLSLHNSPPTPSSSSSSSGSSPSSTSSSSSSSIRWIQHLIRGSFGFYHFGQDSEVMDQGWACAYRAIQMLISWYKLQQREGEGEGEGRRKEGREVEREAELIQLYLQKEVPSLHSIQEKLVSIGDKPPSFLGSQDWLGCCEAFLCLETFVEPSVVSRIVYSQDSAVASSPERLTLLVTHFKCQGTPVMIGGDGGGARVLLGVRYPVMMKRRRGGGEEGEEEEESEKKEEGRKRKREVKRKQNDVEEVEEIEEEVEEDGEEGEEGEEEGEGREEIDWKRFELLLIDPHYCGVDEVEEVRRSCCCGWKNARKFFQTQTHFYNLCLPQAQ